jgi:hypothetical protein
MRNVTDFLPFVTPYLPGVSDPMAEQAIVSACIEFCGRSLLVQNTSWEDAVVGESALDVEEPSMQSLSKVLAVFHLDVKLTPRSREMVARGHAARGLAITGVTTTDGTPTEWFNRDPAEPVISVYPAPDTAGVGAFTIVAALQPTRGATKVADVLYDDFAEDIAAGAIARLLLMPAQPFTAPNLAKPYRDQFRGAISAAATQARVGQSVASSRVLHRAFA